MKRVLCVLLTACLCVGAAGCGNGKSYGALKKENEELQQENEGLKKEIEELGGSETIQTDSKEDLENKNQGQNKEDFDINKLSFKLEIIPSNSWVEISGAYTNNSAYTITQIIVTYIDEMTNNTVYFGSYDTVLPGETSPISSGDTIDNMDAKMEYIKPISYAIRAVDSTGKEFDITYDVKLDKYEVR